MRDIIRLVIPPIVPLVLRKVRLAMQRRRVEAGRAVGMVRWCRVSAGTLAGRFLYMDSDAKAYQAEMLKGLFDDFMFRYIDCRDWTGKVIYDIGGHIGFHTLNFACRVGHCGRVLSFEPHPLHQQRMQMNLSRNSDLESRVSVFPVAVSNTPGKITLFSSQDVDGGGSSGSFIEDADTCFLRESFKHLSPIEVESIRLDDMITSGKYPPPDLVKIDVEGAESLVIEGLIATLRERKVSIVMEVHSLLNMMRVTNLLVPLGYTFAMLKEEDRRCFVAIEPK